MLKQAYCRTLLVFSAVLLLQVSAQAVPVITVGDHFVTEGTTDYQLDVQISGGDAITDMVAFVQIGDGGPTVGGSTVGPEVKSVSYTGSIWDGLAGGITPNSTIPLPDLIFDPNVSANATGVTATADGILFTLTVDVSGLPVGETYDVFLSGTAGGDTQLQNMSQVLDTQFNNGSITITEIPEPATMTLTMLFGLGSLVRRRRA